ncbi:MFS general substrate transporter [Phanerochaete sordida]|uniref:MFS general substrate transporter n=1 Tax=Phanerochaete sordida TaxID=48140 RepID=A0A9P3G364_9APHY|nr:MFS general substrate transporter [Phanerochaete sordida]
MSNRRNYTLLPSLPPGPSSASLIPHTPSLPDEGLHARPSHSRTNTAFAIEDMGNDDDIAQVDVYRADPDVEGIGYAVGDLDGKTALEAKTAVISRALDETGMGRYQWCIFFLCGFGYALDLMWAQAFSLVTPRIQQELGVPDEQYGDIFSVFSAGLTVGAFTWGILVDIIGRRWAFNLTVGIVAVFGMILGALDSWQGICAVVFFVGFGLGGNIPIDATIVLEFLPNDRRYLLAALSVFQPIGVIITSLISWGLVPNFACDTGLPACSSLRHSPTPVNSSTCCTRGSNAGWRYALYTLGGLSVMAFFARFFLFTFYESPKFLISKGRDAEACEVIRCVAQVNGRESSIDEGELEEIDRRFAEVERASRISGGGSRMSKTSRMSKGSRMSREGSRMSREGSRLSKGATEGEDGVGGEEKARRIKVPAMGGHLQMLFSSPAMVRLTLLTWVCYAADYWGFVIAGNFLPKFLADRGAADNVSTAVTYRNYIIIAVVGVPGVLLGTALIEIPYIGRKWAMVGSSALMGASLFLYAVITTPAASVGFNAMEYFFQSTFNAVLYGWTPEAFPAQVRGSACGLASFWGRLSSIVAPLVAARLGSSMGVLYLAGGGVFLSTLCALFLPETKGGEVL